MVLWLCGRSSFAQPLSPPEPPSYQSLRFEEDYRYLHDPARRTDVWDVIKYVPLRDNGAWYLSLGGELRERYEYFHNALWGQGPQDENGFLLQRYMLHADMHMGEARTRLRPTQERAGERAHWRSAPAGRR